MAWWSLTKLLVAAAALRLAAAGTVALADPVAGEGRTLAALLAHRAGIPDYGALPAWAAAVAAGDPPWDDATILARIGPFGPPGPFRYSNPGYLLVRRHLERATGLPLAAILAREVFGPLGLTARLAGTEGDLADLALPVPPGFHPGWVCHGLAIGPATEAAQAVAGILAGPLLPPAARAAMRDAPPLGTLPPGRPWHGAAYGLGLMRGRLAAGGDARVAVEGHGGEGPGSVAAAYAAGSRAAAAFAAGADPGVAERAVARALLGDAP